MIVSSRNVVIVKTNNKKPIYIHDRLLSAHCGVLVVH